MSSPIAAPTDAPSGGEHGLLPRLFELGIAAKAVFASIETAAGLALLATPNARIQGWLHWLTQAELVEDPSDPLARRLLAALGHLDADSQHSYAVYLLGHGLLKLAVVALLARRVAAAYPLAIAVFAGFVAYQLHRWTLTGSPAMLALSALDALVIWLTWQEWRGAAARG